MVAQKDLDTWEGNHYAADQDYRFAKANLDAQRYIAEAAVVQKRKDAANQQAQYKKQEKHVTDLNARLQDVTRKRDAARARVDLWLSKIKAVEDKRKALNGNIDLLNKQLTTVEMKGPNLLLNLPMLDFINPTLKIDQVVLPDLFIDMNYMGVPRVDRCMTCHRAIDRPGIRIEERGRPARAGAAAEARQLPDRPGEARRDRKADRAAQAHRECAAGHSQSVPHASEARHVRRIGVTASAARVRMHGLPSRTGSRHRVRPRRPHSA